MSTFKTVLPVDVKALLDLLPSQRTHVESVDWNPATESIEILWSNPDLVTPFTFPLDFPVDNLKAKKLPEGVKHETSEARQARLTQQRHDAIAPEPKPKPKKKSVKAVDKTAAKTDKAT